MNAKIYKQDLPNFFSLPKRFERLRELAFNYWWAWNPEAQALFFQVDRPLWDRVHHNPVAFLRKVDRARLNALVSDNFYVDQYDRVMRNFDEYMKAENTWTKNTHPEILKHQIAYFSFEFGLHESLPVYAGGLGILSGDHLKEASDLGLPLVGIGFIYTQGYFVQKITEDGWQETNNYFLNLDEMPVIPLYTPDDKPLTIEVVLADHPVKARLWKVQVGRVLLFLLDTNCEENSTTDRQLAARLYSNDPEVRVAQEILLGIGGARALQLLGYVPSAWHMNEGHSAFLAIERIRNLVENGMPYPQAVEMVRRTNIFTTHTPVPAGNDMFPLWLVDKYFNRLWPELGLSREDFVALGEHAQTWGDAFSMPVLALHLSNHCNAVSELHGQVSRQMWQFLYPGKRVDDVPITSITNAVHLGTWMARRLRLLFERYFGPDWLQHLDDPEMWVKIDAIPDGELWAVRRHLKSKLVRLVDERARQQWLGGSKHPVQIVASGALMEPYSLTIGFARRFATYKRGNLLFRDLDRLMRLINNTATPVQFVFAGKAHPADEPGKLIIQQVYRMAKDARAGGRLIFLEDYDMNLARYLVQGVDVWLNTPRRPNEASGTSGMKAMLNGVLNCSVMDGWWREGYDGSNGWSIGRDEDIADPHEQDNVDAASLYNLLENEIVPLYYQNRSSDSLSSKAWIARIKASYRTLAPQFNMQRMVKEYAERLYLPVLQAVDSGFETLDERR